MSALYGLDYLSIWLFSVYPDLPWVMLNGIVIIMPTIGYIDQLKRMIQTKNSSAFSMSTALILLFSNTLRFIYWTFEPFQTYLLGQSIAVFLIQMILALKSFEYGDFPRSFVSPISQTKIRLPSKHELKNALKIADSNTPFEFIISCLTYTLIIIATFAVMALLIGLKASLQIIIFAANIIDTTVSFPLFKRIVFEHNIENLSVVLLGQYLLGDILKIIMFTVGKSGMAFIFGALLQTTIDGTDAIFYAVLSKTNKGKTNEEEVPLMKNETTTSSEFL